jgi:hypothetical protein
MQRRGKDAKPIDAPGRASTCRGPALALVVSALLVSSAAFAGKVVVPGPDAGSRRFGDDIILLSNGNYLVTDPEWSGAASAFAGAVYLYAPDGELLSRLTGASAGDRIGSGGILLLSNGNFVVRSPAWRASGTIEDAGAVTWGDAETGFGASTTVGIANSLVGSSAGDRIGGGAAIALSNGHFVVASGDWDRDGQIANAGAATWCAGDGSTVGPVSAGNSLVGASRQDRVGGTTIFGKPGVIALRDGNYVVVANTWDNGFAEDAGAVTWAPGDGSLVGEVSVANSLVGTQAADYVGADVQPLANGNYIVQNPNWDNAALVNAGAVTWADGSVATVGTIGAHNSLVGSHPGDQIGLLATTLENGNYVVASPLWDDDAVENVGAVTWRNGSGVQPGVVSATNSLVGTHPNDSIGYITIIGLPPLGIIRLSNDNYVVASPDWDMDQLTDAGAATWGDGSVGVSGPISAQNSIIGSAIDDNVGLFIVPLLNGNYVVASPFWSEERGAATWGDGVSGSAGSVSAANSLVGSQPEDFVAASGIHPLPNGDYIVASERWSAGETLRVGAATRGAGVGGIAGEVTPQNSIIGALRNDQVGAGGATALPDGGYLLQSALASGRGAITRIASPRTIARSVVTPQNSLIGESTFDRLGAPGTSVLPDGAIVLRSSFAAIDGAGAITLFERDDPFIGIISEEFTVRSTEVGGGPLMSTAYLESTQTLLVGDPLANRIVRLQANRIWHDGFETAAD